MKYQLLGFIFLFFTNISQSQDLEGCCTKLITDDLYYIPSVSDMSLFQNKGEAVIDAFALSAFGLNAAYAPKKHLVVMVSYNYALREDRDIMRIEGGAGYFGSLRNQHWIYSFNVAGGIGKSNVSLNPKHETGATMNESLKFYNISAHAVFGYRHNRVEVAISPRLYSYHFFDYKDMNGPATHRWLYGEILNDNSGTVLETSLMVRAGDRKLKLFAQLSVPALLNENKWKVNFYDRFNIYTGLSFRIFPRKGKGASGNSGT